MTQFVPCSCVLLTPRAWHLSSVWPAVRLSLPTSLWLCCPFPQDITGLLIFVCDFDSLSLLIFASFSSSFVFFPFWCNWVPIIPDVLGLTFSVMCSSVGISFLPVSFLLVGALLRAICVHFARSYAFVHFFPNFSFLLRGSLLEFIALFFTLPSSRSMPEFIAIFFIPIRGCFLIAQAACWFCERSPRWLLLRCVFAPLCFVLYASS